MKRWFTAVVLLLLTVLPIAASPLGALTGVSWLFSIGFGVAPFGGKVRYPMTLEMSLVWPSMVGLGVGLLQTGEMLVGYGFGEYGIDPFSGDVLYLPVKARVGGGSRFGQWTWAAALSAGFGAVLAVEGTSFSNPFLVDLQGLATAVWYSARADGRRFDVFPEASAGIYVAGE